MTFWVVCDQYESEHRTQESADRHCAAMNERQHCHERHQVVGDEEGRRHREARKIANWGSYQS